MAGRGWRERNSASVLVTMCGHVWRVRRIRRRPKSRHVERLLTWEGTRGQLLCQVVIGGRFLPDERKRSIIMDRQNWFNGLGKGGVRLERKKVVTFRSDEGTNAHAVGRRTDDKVDGSIVDQMLWRLESINSTMGIRKFQGKTTYRTSPRCEWILSRKIGGSEDVTQTSPAQDPSWSTLSQPDCFYPSTVPSRSTSHFPICLW